MTETQATAAEALRPKNPVPALIGLLLGMFVSMLANTVVSSSLPVIVHDLEGDQTAYTWVVTASLVTMAISTPIWGKLADLFNRKVLIQIAVVIFLVATMAAGLSQSTDMLIACRAIQGIGSGGLAALSQIVMADIISPRERGRYMGLFGAVMAVATVGGPLLGGVITDAIDWRWNFYVAIPFAAVALVIQWRTLHLPKRAPRKVRIDYLGIVFLSVATGLLLVWVSIAGDSFDWWSVETVLMLGGAIVSTVLFIITELRSKEPLIPLTMFRDRTFTLAVIASVATGLAMFGAAVFLSQYMQLARGATPTQAGLMTTPMVGGLLLASVGVGALITKYGKWKPYLILGAVLLIAGSWFLSTIHYDTSFWLVSLYMFLLGAGVGMTMQNLVLVVQNTAKPEEVGVASSGVTFFRSLGGTIGVSIMGAALATRVSDLVTERQSEIASALQSLGAQGAELAKGLQTGAIPQVSEMPEVIKVIFEDIYASGISHSFLIAVPFAVASLIAIVFLPNTSLTKMTTTERMHAEEANLATVSSAEGMEQLPITGNITLPGAASAGEQDATEAAENETTEEEPR